MTDNTHRPTCIDCGSQAHRRHPAARRGTATTTLRSVVIDNPEEDGESAPARAMRAEDQRAAVRAARG